MVSDVRHHRCYRQHGHHLGRESTPQLLSSSLVLFSLFADHPMSLIPFGLVWDDNLCLVGVVRFFTNQSDNLSINGTDSFPTGSLTFGLVRSLDCLDHLVGLRCWVLLSSTLLLLLLLFLLLPLLSISISASHTKHTHTHSLSLALSVFCSSDFVVVEHELFFSLPMRFGRNKCWVFHRFCDHLDFQPSHLQFKSQRKPNGKRFLLRHHDGPMDTYASSEEAQS